MYFVANVLGVTEVGTSNFLTLFAYFFPVVDSYAEEDSGDEEDVV